MKVTVSYSAPGWHDGLLIAVGISAIVVAIQMIGAFCRHLKYIKKIVLVTNGTGMFDPDGLDAIAAQIERERIELTVLLVASIREVRCCETDCE